MFQELRKQEKFKVPFGQKNKISGDSSLQGKLNAINKFGKANRPQTPVRGIISGDYANQAEIDLKEKYLQVAAERKEKRKNPMLNVPNTRARELAAIHLKNYQSGHNSPIDNFRLKRFDKVPAKVSTNNFTSERRNQSMSYAQNENNC